MQTAKIKVAIRLRPFLTHELNNGYTNSRISINKQKKQIEVQDLNHSNRKFDFDYLFSDKVKQDELYHQCGIQHMIDKAIEGYHSTIFAYGQTGSGKTYSMQGVQQFATEAEGKRGLDGIIPKVINNLYKNIQLNSAEKTFTVYVSYLQIYNERIYDLLNPSSLNPKNINSSIGGLRLRWNKNEQFSVQNLFVFQCKNADELHKYFHYGLKNRINSSHKLNMNSSRSHTILTIKIESFDHKNPNNILSSKVELVDLAGSQRIGMTGTEGKLAKQSIDINKSLFTLRQVISTLADWNKNKSKQLVHIPYRQSKLTSILKQSIGGNSYSLMIACINPADQFLQQNLSTLTYASKATMITNKPTINDDPRSKMILDLKNQVRQLQDQLVKANKHIQLVSNQPKQQRNKTPLRKEDQNQPIPHFRKKISEKLNTGNYDQFSDRLVESINMVRQLLKSNKDLRQELQISHKNSEAKDISIYELEKQNESLREKLNEIMISQSYLQMPENKPKSRPKINSSNKISYNMNKQLQSGHIEFYSTTNNIRKPDNTYNTFNSFQFYQNQTGMDNMPTNFNKRQINTAQGERRNSDVERYRNTFTSANSRNPVEKVVESLQKRLSSGYKNGKVINNVYNQVPYF